MSLIENQLTCELIIYMNAAYSEHGNSGSIPVDAMPKVHEILKSDAKEMLLACEIGADMTPADLSAPTTPSPEKSMHVPLRDR